MTGLTSDDPESQKQQTLEDVPPRDGSKDTVMSETTPGNTFSSSDTESCNTSPSVSFTSSGNNGEHLTPPPGGNLKPPPPGSLKPPPPSSATNPERSPKKGWVPGKGDQVVALEPSSVSILRMHDHSMTDSFRMEPSSAVVSSASFDEAIPVNDATSGSEKRGSVGSASTSSTTGAVVRASHRSSRRTRKADDSKKEYVLADSQSDGSSVYSMRSVTSRVLLEPSTSIVSRTNSVSMSESGAVTTLRRQEQELLKQDKVSARTITRPGISSQANVVSLSDAKVAAMSVTGSVNEKGVARRPSEGPDQSQAPGAYRITSMRGDGVDVDRDEDADGEDYGIPPPGPAGTDLTGDRAYGLGSPRESAIPVLKQESAPDDKEGDKEGAGVGATIASGGGGLLHAQAVNEADLEAEFKDRFLNDLAVEATQVKHLEIGEDGMDDMTRIAYMKLKRRNRMCGCLLLIVAIAVGLGVGLGVSFNDTSAAMPTASPTPAPTLTPYGSLRQLVSPYSSDDDLDDETSPQAKAIDWLLNKDPAQLLPLQEGFAEWTLLERYAMAVLFFSTDGPKWDENLDFMSESSVCDWPRRNSTESTSNVNRIKCNEDGHIYDLRIHFNSLNGTIPAELSALSLLELMSFSANSLHGTIPSQFGALSSLWLLQIDMNFMTGSIPEKVAALPKLSTLNLFMNSMSGTLPPSLLARPILGLKICDLGENHFEGTVPPIREQSPLEIFYLEGNNFTGMLPPSIYAQPNLDTLGLSDNSFNGTFGQGVAGWTNLKYAYLDRNQFSGAIPSQMGLLKALEELNLQDNALVGTIPPELSKVETLIDLDLSGNQLTGTLAEALGTFRHLEIMNLDSNIFLTGKVPSSFGQMTSLVSLSMVGTGITSGLQESFCNQPTVFTAISADCGGDAPGVECTCCTSCCDSSLGDASEAGACAVNVTATCLTKAGRSEIEEGRGAVCTCSENRDLGAVLSCTDTECQTCNLEGSMCAINTDYGFVLNTTSEVIAFQNTLIYTSGVWNGTRLTYYDDVDSELCDFYVNGEKCENCYATRCISGFEGFQVTCDNLEGVSDADGVILGGYSFNSCVPGKIDVGYLAILESHDTAHLSGCKPLLEVMSTSATT